MCDKGHIKRWKNINRFTVICSITSRSDLFTHLITHILGINYETSILDSCYCPRRQRCASVSDELDLDSEGKNSCNVGSYKTTSCQVSLSLCMMVLCMFIYNTITHYSSAQTWCEGAIADKWATYHGCDLEQVQDITNHHKEWDWFSCDTTSIPIWDQVTTSSVEGKGPSCKLSC